MIKLLCYSTFIDLLDEKKRWIQDEIGATVFKIIEDKFVAHILFVVPDKESEMMLILKYPSNTFSEVES